jgi:hypothetical protein
MTDNADKFKDIRPYNDDEIHGAIMRVINSDEFMEAIIGFRFSKIEKYTGGLLKPILRRYFMYKWGGIRNVDDMQQVVVKFMVQMIDTTTTSFTYSGLENLDKSQNYLFISNHRDIAMDPSFVNWALFKEGFQTLRIAIGDNLLSKPFTSDIMRMNKSFIVKRSLPKGRAMLKGLQHLSHYISYSIKNESGIWIAQREGRAKDGFDRTEPAIIKMLSLAGRADKKEFSEHINDLNIVPVAVSYELDACDEEKAQGLFQQALLGYYHKSEFEDIQTIVNGILGQKGAVHIAFGKPLKGKFEDADSVAAEIDSQIYKNYKLHSTNFIAAKADLSLTTRDQQKLFADRLAGIPSELHETVLKMYANPFKNQQK